MRFIFIHLKLFVVDQKWNEMTNAKCEDEVVNILKSKYMPLIVNLLYITFFTLKNYYIIFFKYRMYKNKMDNTIKQNSIRY